MSPCGALKLLSFEHTWDRLGSAPETEMAVVSETTAETFLPFLVSFYVIGIVLNVPVDGVGSVKNEVGDIVFLKMGHCLPMTLSQLLSSKCRIKSSLFVQLQHKEKTCHHM